MTGLETRERRAGEPLPVLLLDVDGVLNVLDPSEEDIRDRGLTSHDAVAQDGHTYRLHIAPETPALLARLSRAFELVWATTWRGSANTSIGPLVGLPGDLEVVWFPKEWTDVPLDYCRKTPWARAWAARRGVTRLAWVDDEVTRSDADLLTRDITNMPIVRAWHRTIEGTPPLTDVCVAPTMAWVGLTEERTERLLRWARGGGCGG